MKNNGILCVCVFFCCTKVYVYILAKCSTCHAVCNTTIPMGFYINKLKMKTKCVRYMDFLYETVWLEPITGTDSATGRPICVSNKGPHPGLVAVSFCLWLYQVSIHLLC